MIMVGAGDTMPDVEKRAGLGPHLGDSAVNNLSWRSVAVSSNYLPKDAKPKPIIANVDGMAKAGESCPREPSISVIPDWKTGEIMAIMGPSGSGYNHRPTSPRLMY